MSLQQKKEIARQFCEETWGKGNLLAVDELASADFKVYYPILPAPLDGEDFKAWITDTHTALPDWQFIINDAIAEAEKVVISWMAQGTHTAQFKLLNLPPTNKAISYTGITIYRIVAGKVVEERGEEDVLGALQQLELIPVL